MLWSVCVAFLLPVLVRASKPTAAQLKMMDIGLAQFMHFSVNPWSSIEHNCVGNNPKCIPASVFNPSNLSTDQWVEAAVSMGAGEICLTAHHEGGFCLWDTKYSSYSVMHSPYGKDVVAQFVASCKKYGVKPCYYMGPNANGYLTNHENYSAAAFVDAQLGMLRELLTNYGSDYVSRLWWDHYPSGCGGLAPCPEGSFPEAWPRFVSLVRELSPSTIICPGPDCDGHQGESGLGKYPVWFPCTPEASNGTELRCSDHAPSAHLAGFHPYEACVTMHNGWFCKGSGEETSNIWWSAKDIWDHYMSSVGIGWVNTLNAPPGTTGQIPPKLVESMNSFGKALGELLKPVTSAAVLKGASVACSNSTSLELDFGKTVTFNAIMTREDLSEGQHIATYGIDYFDATTSNWVTFEGLAPGKVMGVGIHGLSVGARMIDFVPETRSNKVRFRCTSSIGSHGIARLHSFSVHKGQAPSGEPSAILI
eukprot:TRINITY_DN23524_c0_g1_i1.p1 TRINITY_DN23524_c0_g1~~TRINITY_DN23524_c0_g1_i1.p1  ORF type:complete len:478 (-),score=57.43 TRINITY_DN23524_c0_g1_i1:170-1603(-)